MTDEQMKEVRENLYKMTEEEFQGFCKNFTEEQVKIFTEMRFFNRLFNDPGFYNAVCDAVAEVAYEELRA